MEININNSIVISDKDYVHCLFRCDLFNFYTEGYFKNGCTTELDSLFLTVYHMNSNLPIAVRREVLKILELLSIKITRFN